MRGTSRTIRPVITDSRILAWISTPGMSLAVCARNGVANMSAWLAPGSGDGFTSKPISTILPRNNSGGRKSGGASA